MDQYISHIKGERFTLNEVYIAYLNYERAKRYGKALWKALVRINKVGTCAANNMCLRCEKLNQNSARVKVDFPLSPFPLSPLIYYGCLHICLIIIAISTTCLHEYYLCVVSILYYCRSYSTSSPMCQLLVNPR